MKKIIYGSLIAGCLFLVGNKATAQTYAEVEKPGDATPWSIETLINGSFGGHTNGITWNTPSLRARYFVNDNWAARIQLGIGDGSGQSMKEANYFYENPDGTGGEGHEIISRTALSFQLGAEYHFAGTQKLDPYAALGVNFGFGSQKVVETDAVAGAYAKDFSSESKGGYNVIGATLGLGMDFYFVENVYLGLELGLGINAINDRESSFEQVAPGVPTVSVTMPKQHGETFFGTQASLRLGWRF